MTTPPPTSDDFDGADQARRHADLTQAIENLTHDYDSLMLMATYRDEHGFTRSFRIRRGNFFANLGLIRYMADRNNIIAAIDEADDQEQTRRRQSDTD